MSFGGRGPAIGAAAVGIGAALWFSQSSLKSPTANPIETTASQNISDRMSAGGGKNDYTPGVATPRQPENISSPQLGEGRKDQQARAGLMSKHNESPNH
ncbi:hypothetical protein DOTSEDRAFT_20423 [Dothistroma septosporum NZE10]|uniref:Uncharacterized protein n=1 Tax=Dothistroma septosporum (strain NZE10 / CBS 128990) TaxID=675120 RepID=N1Q2R1_DOTSN|nr:hypothetical protein DOTSEDRAFT_20423 [Dothistroma septosporum NZE10]